MQPMLHPRLRIEQAALVAPPLHFLHPQTIGCGDLQLEMSKGFVRLPRVPEAELLAPPRLQVRQELAFDETRQHLLRICVGHDSGVIHLEGPRSDRRRRNGVPRTVAPPFGLSTALGVFRTAWLETSGSAAVESDVAAVDPRPVEGRVSPDA